MSSCFTVHLAPGHARCSNSAPTRARLAAHCLFIPCLEMVRCGWCERMISDHALYIRMRNLGKHFAFCHVKVPNRKHEAIGWLRSCCWLHADRTVQEGVGGAKGRAEWISRVPWQTTYSHSTWCAMYSTWAQTWLQTPAFLLASADVTMTTSSTAFVFLDQNAFGFCFGS